MYKHLRRCTLDDRKILAQALAKAGYEESNHNLINLYMWENWYPLWIYEADQIVLLVGLHEGEYFCYMPLCEQKYFDKAIETAYNLFKDKQIPFVLSCFTEKEKDRVLELFPFLIATAQEEAFDYVYDADKLRTLSGKKYQKRRNHYNAFMKMYAGRYDYEDLGSENIDRCLQLMQRWKKEDQDLFLHYEKEGTLYILEHYDYFDCKGGVIKVDGTVEAFVVGSRLSKEMVQLNIMKANHDIRGLYQVIEKEFLCRSYPDVRYVNKEDDAGNESLRKAKRAYNPIKMIKKYRISE